MAERTCSIESCERKHYARGWCRAHYMRMRRNGALEPVDRSRDRASYYAAHGYLRRMRGPAKYQKCVEYGCGEQARDWSLSYTATEVLVDDGRFFSPNPADYDPRCRSCHKSYDNPLNFPPFWVDMR